MPGFNLLEGSGTVAGPKVVAGSGREVRRRTSGGAPVAEVTTGVVSKGGTEDNGRVVGGGMVARWLGARMGRRLGTVNAG